MAAPTPTRLAALQTLRATRRGTLADVALDAATRELDTRDRAWTRELTYGTLRMRGRLDHRLAALSQRPLARLDPDILDVLRLGAYQLLEMDGVPPWAAISQSVELARRSAAASATGFVNGVLQSLKRAGRAAEFPAFEADPVAHLSTWGSHPRWLVERWVARYGAAGARALVEANNARPRLYLRLLGDVHSATRRLAEAGMEPRPVPWAPRAVEIPQAAPADALAVVPAIVQDPAAGLVADFAAPPAGARVVDLAAAPGGKALALALDRRGSAGPAFVVAADASRPRIARVRQNVARLSTSPPAGCGAVPLGMVVADGRQPPFRPVDVVLLDAPCSGTGTLRRHADGRWRITPDDIGSLARLQAELLDAAAAVVAPGGLLVYATCSLEPEENELQVDAFLMRHDGFRLEPGPVAEPDMLHADGTLRILPQRWGVDGAFAARLRKA